MKQREANNWIAVSLVIDEWILWEYGCCYIGMNSIATVETVSKSHPPDFAAAKVGSLVLASDDLVR